MSHAIGPTLFRRMRHTPLRDALRGRISGRLDVRRRLETSGLPQPAQELIGRVVKRTRLWRLERVEVADELIAHFADGIDAGEPVERLVASFGDERAAARLIARGKRRNRSLAAQAFIGLRRIVIALVVFYALCGVYFLLGRPTVRINHFAEMNRQVTTVPEEQRAWALYRQVIPQMRVEEQGSLTHGATEVKPLLDARPGDQRWTELTQWLAARRDALELARQAARRPALGFVFGPGGSAYDTAVWPQRRPEDEPNPILLSLLLPHLNDLRVLADALAADARWAREQGDGERLVRDIDTLVGMADQLGRDGILVQQYVALGVRWLAVGEIRRTLRDKPELLTTAQLQHLAHRFAKPDSAGEMFSTRYEREVFDDVLQRSFTEDGHGDGRVTPQGLKLLESISRNRHANLATIRQVTGPISPVLAGSRREQREMIEALLDEGEANLRRPARLAQPRPKLDEFLASGPLQRDVRYAFVIALMPSLSGVADAGERYLGVRDGALIAIALETHRRGRGAYPETLDALSPALLPAVPVDRITGGPLRYRIVEGRPLVYSVGADGDDDAGRSARAPSGEPDPLAAAQWGAPRQQPAADGDWVLFPPAVD